MGFAGAIAARQFMTKETEKDRGQLKRSVYEMMKQLRQAKWIQRCNDTGPRGLMRYEHIRERKYVRNLKLRWTKTEIAKEESNDGELHIWEVDISSRIGKE
ncbi:MAG: hypothetical protein Q9176_005212 [Flavoplaca citrina]